jgi:hypothetical protein
VKAPRFTLFEQLVLEALVAILSCLQMMITTQYTGIVPIFVAESTKSIASKIAGFLLQDS